nr:unnamed protein product [Callosobruchus chinensis]
MHERTVIRRKESPRSLFLCCHHDLCNHVDSPQTKNLLNSTLLSDISEEQSQGYQHQQETTYLYSDSDVWFRAATIAVPICGAPSHAHSSPSPAMQTLKDYVPDRFDKAAYDNLLRKDYIPAHHNLFNEESASHALQQPLLAHPSVAVGPPPSAYVPILAPPLASVSPAHSADKNETNAKLNLIHCDSDSEKSIIFGIEKTPTNCCEANLVTFISEKNS